MMKYSFAISLLLLAACAPNDQEEGGGGGDVAPPRSVSSGQYNLSEVTFQDDTCLLANLPTPLAVDVSGNTITFTDLGGANLPSGAFAADRFTARADYVFDNSLEEPGFDCRERIIKQVDGTIDGVDTFGGTFLYQSSVQSGNQCSQDWLGYPVPCTCLLYTSPSPRD